MHYLSVIAIFKNESHCIEEWVNHYLNEGVDHFYMIDNGSTDDYRDKIEKYTHDWKLALDVWHYVQTERSQGHKVSIKDNAIPEIADRTGINEATVKRAWDTHRNLAKAIHSTWVQNLGK